MTLLNQNYKLAKSLKTKYNSFGLELLPHKLANGKTNFCPNASESCKSTCLVLSGHGSMPAVMQNRSKKSHYFINDRENFLKDLKSEINTLKQKKENLTIRLNVFSDLPWENLKLEDKNLFELFPDVQFYDYTKSYKRCLFNSIPNYHLTFSGETFNWVICEKLLKLGINVAMVFKKVPEKYKGYKVIDGDTTDLRFLDEKGVIVGLKYKFVKSKGAKNKDLIKNSTLVFQDEEDI